MCVIGLDLRAKVGRLNFSAAPSAEVRAFVLVGRGASEHAKDDAITGVRLAFMPRVDFDHPRSGTANGVDRHSQRSGEWRG